MNDAAVNALTLSTIRIELTSRVDPVLYGAVKSAGDFSRKVILLKEKTAFEHMQRTECFCLSFDLLIIAGNLEERQSRTR